MFNVIEERKVYKFIDSVSDLYDRVSKEIIPEVKIPFVPLLGADTFNTKMQNLGYKFRIHDDDLMDTMCMFVAVPVFDDEIIINFLGSIVMPLHNASRLLMSRVSDDEALFEAEHTLRHECGHVVDTTTYLGKSMKEWDVHSTEVQSAYDKLPKLRSNAGAAAIFNWYVQYHNIEDEARADMLGGTSIKDYAIDFVLANKEVPYRKLGVSEYISKEEYQMILSGNYRSIVV